MFGLHDNSDTARFERIVERIREFGGQPLLNLQPASISIDEPGQFGNTDDLRVGLVGDVHAPTDRRHVMLTCGFERYVAQHDQIVVTTDFAERRL